MLHHADALRSIVEFGIYYGSVIVYGWYVEKIRQVLVKGRFGAQVGLVSLSVHLWLSQEDNLQLAVETFER